MNKMLGQKKHELMSIYEIYLGFFSGGIILFPKLTGLFFLILIGITLFLYFKKEMTFKLLPISAIFILFYLAYLIGCLFTRHADWAAIYIENKLSFLLFPLLLSFRSKIEISLGWCFLGAILGTLLMDTYGVFHAFEAYSINHEMKSFYTVSISPIHHPTYLSVYNIVSCLLAIEGYRKSMKWFSLWWIIPFIVIAIILHFYFLSLSGLIFLVFVIGLLLFFWLYSNLSKIYFLGICLLFPFVFYFLIFHTPILKSEAESAKMYFDEFIKDPIQFMSSRPAEMSGSEVRIVMWTTSWITFKENPMGVGTGNVDEYLEKRLVKFNQSELSKKMYNPHNQFLQTGMEIGIFGLLLLLAIIMVPLISSLRYRSLPLLFITLSLAFNSLFESMLQRQSGIVFYTFWIILLTRFLVEEANKNSKVNSQVLS